MTRKKKWPILWILIPILMMGMIGLLLIHYFLDPNLYRNVFQESLITALGREVSIGKTKISLWGGVGIVFEDFRIKDRSLAFDLLRAKRLILKVKLLPLLKREVKWKRIVLDRPTLHFLRDKNGQFNMYDAPLTTEGLKASQQKMIQTLSTLFGGSFTLRDGEISFSDESLGDSPQITEIRSFNLHLSKVSYHKPFPFHLNGEIVHSKKEGEFSISGTIQNLPEDMDLSKGKLEAEVKMKGIETFHFWPYLKTLLPMKTISGTLDLNAHYQGDLSGAFKTSAKIKFRDMVYDHPQVFAHILTPKWLNLDLDLDYDLKEIKVHRISLELPEIGVKAKGKIYGLGTKEMGIEAEAQSGSFDLSEGKKFIPYRIITPNVSDPLFRGEGNGSVQIVSVKLSGKMPEIEHCDQLQYAHTLSVEVKLNKARVKFPWNLPALEDLKGHLLFKEGNLNLKEVEGRFLHSTIDRANGIFYRLLLVPTLQIHSEGRLNLTDFPSLMKIGESTNGFSETLSPITALSGTAQYQLSAKGELKPPLHFQHQGVYRLSKVRFVHPQVPFSILIGEGKVDLSNEGLQWSGAKVEFGHSSLLMNGSWRRGEKSGPFEMMARGRVDLKNLLSLCQSPLFPEDIRLKTKGVESFSGTGQFSFKGRGPTGHRSFSYEGELMPKEASLLLKGVSYPLKFREGAFSFSNLGVGFSKVKIQSGNSSFVLDGVIKEGNWSLSTTGSIDLKHLYSFLQSPLAPDPIRSEVDEIQELAGGTEVRLKWFGRIEEGINAIKEGKIQLKGVSFQHRKIPVPLSQIEGSFLFSPKQIQFVGLKGKLGDSPLALSGSISRNEQRRGLGRSVSFQLSSSQLDLDPLFPKREEPTPTSFEKIREWLSNWSFEGKVDIGQGKYRAFHYQDLKAEMKTVDGKLFFHPFQSKTDGGDVWGEGWIQPTEKGIRFEIKPRVSNIEAKAFVRTFLQKGEEQKVLLTGRVHIDKVELRGEGENFQKVKESLNGSLRLEIEEGVIEKFNVLAKIFSILNVSQLLRGRFPDLKTQGLPYHQIMANIHVKDGIASTEDFLVDSDAMKITIFGKVDLGKNLIDAKIGVHPLVTVDTVLSKIPIAGYILTGKDKAFLSFYYEVKGELNDPKIEAIPIKGLGEGFFGIIRRLLETPFRPFPKAPSPDKEKK
ncbi:MAG: AsmA-like C-terminal domain-containing protein [Thermodesulfobacteriota bacterium]